MTREPKIPYDSFPDISKDFVDEMHFRSQSATRAVEIFQLYQGTKVSPLKDARESRTVRYIALRFAISEIATLIDGRGRLSIQLSKNKVGKYCVNRNRLRKLLPSLPVLVFERLYKKVSNLIDKNQTLVNRILYTRNHRIAHASIVHYRGLIDRVSLSETRFPMKRFAKFTDQFESIALQAIFGVEVS